jgi:hypothetical protein
LNLPEAESEEWHEHNIAARARIRADFKGDSIQQSPSWGRHLMPPLFY